MKKYVTKLLNWITFERGVIALVVLNLFDAVSTHLALHLGFAYEVNPLLRWAFALSPALFWLIKMMLVVVGMLAIGRLGSARTALGVLITTNAMYLMVMFVHVYGWVMYLTGSL